MKLQRWFPWERLRFWIPIFCLAVLSVRVGYFLFKAHISPTVASQKYDFVRQLPGRRGSIFDASGKLLAKSVSIWEYHLDPVSLTNRVVKRKGEPPRPREAIVKTIANALKLNYRDVLKMANSPKRRGWRSQFLARSSDPVAHEIITNSLLVAGVAIDDKWIRQYPNHRRMSHVLGSINAEYVGSSGIEQKYNSYLTGTPGQICGIKDAKGHEVYDRRKVEVAPIPGADIYLTLDGNLQYEVETALIDGIEQFGAGSGWCIVMNAKSAAILALASFPDYDPVLFGRTDDDAKINRACAYTYEPGSVMKVITAAAGFDCGLVKPDTMYNTNRHDERYYRLPGDGSHVWDEQMSIGDAVVHSSNIVIGKLGVDLGPERLWNYMSAFGFGKKTNVELPGEEAGILPFWKRWDKVKWSRAPIGQGVAVTAIQLISAYQAIANNGLRLRPHLVSKIVASDGTHLYRHSNEPLGRPIRPETAAMLREVMKGVASSAGTAHRAAIRGYSVAGKTGTAQKQNPNGKGYSDHLFRATFCGMVPASKPEVVILVTLDFNQRAKFHQGGNSAGPVFRRVATAALRYLMIPPDKPEEISEFEDDDEFDIIMEERAQKMEEFGDSLWDSVM